MSGAAIAIVIGVVMVAIGLADGATAQTAPLPPARPLIDAPADRGIDPSHLGLKVAPAVTACQLRLAAAHAVFKPLGEMSGPGGCGGPDIVQLEHIVLPDRTEVAVDPPATLRCETAEAIASFVQTGLAPAVAAMGGALSAIENFDSYECRGRNRIAGAPLSEHGRANALDIRALRLKDGRILHPSDDAVPHAFRLAMKNIACARFTTVLGPGSDGYHEDHVHVDLAERASGYRLCQWDLHDAARPDVTGAVAAHSYEAQSAAASSRARVAALPYPVPLPRARPFVAAGASRATLPSAERRP
jgi:hypothetical protein